jgi:hypothetical protein
VIGRGIQTQLQSHQPRGKLSSTKKDQTRLESHYVLVLSRLDLYYMFNTRAFDSSSQVDLSYIYIYIYIQFWTLAISSCSFFAPIFIYLDNFNFLGWWIHFKCWPLIWFSAEFRRSWSFRISLHCWLIFFQWKRKVKVTQVFFLK